ncbi:hypothetical protein [Microcystis viridis]|uniref:hypothetical protein n=1 Tax=Microcystis viridis TaxID=44822 RepID=UPI001E30072D|nr:hypothetical protein [Microcystis viridis]
MRNPARERSRNLNREVWESPSVYGGEDVKEWLIQLQGQVVGLDTAPLIYLMEQNQAYWDLGVFGQQKRLKPLRDKGLTSIYDFP